MNIKYNPVSRYLVLVIFLQLLFLHFVSGQTRSGFIRAGDYRVYYEDTGKGEAVFLLHAGLQNHRMWDEQVETLSTKYRVITMDLPYHGKTTGKDTTMLAKDVIRVLADSLDLEKISIIGLSMGASITQDFVIAHPERVHKVILLASGINGYEKKFPLDSATQSWITDFFAALEAGDTTKSAFIFARTWGDGSQATGDDLVKLVSRQVYAVTLENLRKHHLAGWPRMDNDPPAIDRLSEIKRPVLIIHGNEDLPFIDQSSRYLEQSISGSKRILLNNVAHMINLEASSQLNQIILDFLR